MSYSEIVETSANGKFRAKITIDEDAHEPYDDGAVPILKVESGYYGGVVAEAFNTQANQYVDAFNQLCDLENGNGYVYEVFERYMRIFHGATVFNSYNLGVSREYGYIGFDSAEWRERVGADPERLKEEKILSEVEAWASGDVWGIVVEKLVSWSTEDEDYDDFDDWQEVDYTACWGFYGRDYAEQEAKEELARVVAADAEK